MRFSKPKPLICQKVFLVFLLLFGLVTLSCRQSQNLQDYTEDDYSLQITPGSKKLATPGQLFEVKIKLTNTMHKVPAGYRLKITPFPTRIWNGPPPEPLVTVTNGNRNMPYEIDADALCSSVSTLEQGSGYRYFIQFPEGLTKNSVVKFQVSIPVRWPHDSQNCRCSLSLGVQMLAADDSVSTTFNTPTWQIARSPGGISRLLLPSQAEVNEPVIALLSSYNYSYPSPIKIDLSGLSLPENAELLSTEKREDGSSFFTLRFLHTGIFTISIRSDNNQNIISNPIRVGRKSERQILWGDLHLHTLYSWDSRNLEPMCRLPGDTADLAWDISRLDFIAITDHGQHDLLTWKPVSDPLKLNVDMPKPLWDQYLEEILSVDNSRVMVFAGYEHRDKRGDTNMIFRDKGQYFKEKDKRLDHKEQWERHELGELLSIPHLHPTRGIEEFTSASKHEILVEIHSGHTTYEYYMNPSPIKRQKIAHRHKDGPYVRDLLAQGLKLGFTASADHNLVGTIGLTAVLTKEKTKDAIFDALLARRTYATTGSRMLMELTVGKRSIGEEVVVKKDDIDMEKSRIISGEVIGQGLIKKVQVIRNNKVIFEENPGTLIWRKTFTDEDALFSLAEHRPLTDEKTVFYYLRVEQSDGHIGWTSPIFFICDL